MEELSRHWEKIHSAKLSDVSWWQEKDALWLDLFTDLDLDRSAPIIDVGSGATELVSGLLDLGFTDVTALDISAAALANLKSRLADPEARVKFQVSDVRDLVTESQFALWHDRAVFHFLNNESDQKAYVDSVIRNLRPAGVFIVATFAPAGPEQCSGLPVTRHDQASLVQIFGDRFLLLDCQSRIHVTPWGSQQPFTIARFTRARLAVPDLQ